MTSANQPSSPSTSQTPGLAVHFSLLTVGLAEVLACHVALPIFKDTLGPPAVALTCLLREHGVWVRHGDKFYDLEFGNQYQLKYRSGSQLTRG